MSRGLALLLLAALFTASSGASRAQQVVLTGTMKAIADRGTMLIGVREAAVPFSFRNKAGQPVGFSVDICHGIASDVAASLGRDLLEPDAPAWQTGVRIVYVPVAPEARLPKIVAGDIDIECGSTTDTAERTKTVAFSPVFFLAGTRIIAATSSKVTSYRDLKSIAVSTGTTTADVVKRVAASASPPARVVETPDVPSAYAMLLAGSVDAIASDDVLLAGLLATTPEGHLFHLVGDYLSFEPYALPFRRDDPDFAALVDQSFARMAQSGILATRYRRWFVDELPDGENLALPMSAQLTEMYRALGQPD